MKSLFKILIMAILGLSVVGGELLDLNEWREAEKQAEERGTKCYRDQYGNFFCKDTK